MRHEKKEYLENLLNDAIGFGLAKNDQINAKEFINHHEYGLAFDTIVEGLYENDLEVKAEFYEKLQSVGLLIKVNESSYSFLQELIIDNDKIPNSRSRNR